MSTTTGTRAARHLLVAVTGVLFSLWVTFASGYQAVYQALIVVLFGIIVYAVLNGRRERSGRIPQPADLPDGTAVARSPHGAAGRTSDDSAGRTSNGSAGPGEGTG